MGLSEKVWKGRTKGTLQLGNKGLKKGASTQGSRGGTGGVIIVEMDVERITL